MFSMKHLSKRRRPTIKHPTCCALYITPPSRNPQARKQSQSTELVKVLSGLPSSLVPADIHRFVSKFINTEPIAITSIIYLPHQSIPFSVQSNILIFENLKQIAELEENLQTIRTRSIFVDHQVKLERIEKHPFGFNYLKAISNNNPSNSSSKSCSSNLIPLRSGKAVLISGLPINSNPTQIENTISNFGFPICKVQSMSPTERMGSCFYWPFLDPSPICISNKLNKIHNKPISSITRSQLIYTPSISISHFLVGELHQSRPSWLGYRRSPANTHSPQSDQPSPSGWKLKAQVIY